MHAICFSEGPHSGRGKAVWGDQGLSRTIVSGFSLVGEMPESDQFPTKLKSAAISVQQLESQQSGRTDDSAFLQARGTLKFAWLFVRRRKKNRQMVG